LKISRLQVYWCKCLWSMKIRMSQVGVYPSVPGPVEIADEVETLRGVSLLVDDLAT
jgi:hypothetical protein